jgi:hypothetical protein
MATATRLASGRRPIFLQPVDAAGNVPPSFTPPQPAFQAFLDAWRADTASGMDPSRLVAAAYLQVLREAHPNANAAVGSLTSNPPHDWVAPSGPARPRRPFADALTEETIRGAAFVPVPPKPAGLIMSGLPDKAASVAVNGAGDGHHSAAAGAGRRRRLAASLVDDAARWAHAGRTPCTLLPHFYPTPQFEAAASNPATSPVINLAGRVAVVTGASSGLGVQTASQLAAAGVTVIGTSRTPGAYKGTPWPYNLTTLDMTDQASVDAFASYVSSHPAVMARGGLDFAVLNAGRFALGSPG